MAITSSSPATAYQVAQQYSTFMLRNLEDGLLPNNFFRNVSDFGQGSTLNIPTVGEVTIQEAAEDTALEYRPIETGNVTFSITDYTGDAWYITDDAKEDNALMDTLLAERARSGTRALQEHYETRMLATANAAQTGADLNLVNGRPHRWVAGGSGGSSRNMTFDDLVSLKLSFDKANVPVAGRIIIVDPIVEASLNQSLSFTSAVDHSPKFEALVESGFAREHKFLMNILGFDIWTSNRLPVLTATEALDASSYGLANDTAEVGDVVNVAMCVAGDEVKPLMSAWRRMPKTEGERNKDRARDEFVTRARFGWGAQRVDTLATIITSASTY